MIWYISVLSATEPRAWLNSARQLASTIRSKLLLCSGFIVSMVIFMLDEYGVQKEFTYYQDWVNVVLICSVCKLLLYPVVPFTWDTQRGKIKGAIRKSFMYSQFQAIFFRVILGYIFIETRRARGSLQTPGRDYTNHESPPRIANYDSLTIIEHFICSV